MAVQQTDTKALFLKALKDLDAKAYQELSASHKSKSATSSVQEMLKSLTPVEFKNMWASIFVMSRKATTSLLEVEDPELSDEKMSVSSATDILQSFIVVANFVLDALRTIPDGLIQMISLLHGLFHNFGDNLKNSICQLCEKFYIRKGPDREELLVNSLPYLINRTLGDKRKKKDIKRVWAMREAIGNAVMTEIKDVTLPDEKKKMLNLVKACVNSLFYLSSAEGMKFLEFLLCLHVDIFYETIKSAFPRCSLQQAEKVGIIYYNAWLHAAKSELTELREKLEFVCIQDVMYCAIHVERNRPRSLVPLLRMVLSVFHKNKKEVIVLRMLRHKYQPILWRALKTHNSNARTNAAQLLFDVFPLEDPDFNVAETEIELERQLIIMKELLVDDCIYVRCVSAIGVCVVMSCHWELISPDMINTYFRILIEELSVDSSSAEVRCSVIKGLEALLVGNQLAIPTLKVFLPKFKDLFEDVSEKVRMAFCQLLLAVKNIRFIKYWEIVPLEDLLARMESDKTSVAKLIVQLLCNSYFPGDKPEEFSLRRCIELIKTDRRTSMVFFIHAPEFVGIEVIVKFMAFTSRMLHVYVQSKDKKSKKSLSADDKENENTLNSNFKSGSSLAFDDIEVVGGILDALSILWISIQKILQKPKNKLLYKELIARFGRHMPPLLKYFEGTEVWPSVLMLCGMIPPSFIPSLANTCLTKLENLPPDAKWKDFTMLLVCLCNQQKTSDLLILIDKWIQSGLKKEVVVVKKKKQSKKSLSKTSEVPPKPLLAVKFLEVMIEQPICRMPLVQPNIPKLKEMVNSISAVQAVLMKSKNQLADEEEATFLFKTVSVLSKISVLLEAEQAMDSVKFIQDLLLWVTDVFFKSDANEKSSRRSRKRTIEPQATETWKNLGFMISEDLLDIIKDMVRMGYLKNSAKECVEFTKNALKSDYGPKLLKRVACFLFHLCESLILLLDDTPLQTPSLQLVQQCFVFIISICKSENFFSEVPESDVVEIKYSMRDILLMHLKYDFVTKEHVASLIKTVLNALYHTAENLIPDDASTDVSTSRFSALSLLYIYILTGNIKLTKLFFSIVVDWAKEDISHRYVACLIVSHVTHEYKSVVKSARREIQKFIEESEKFECELSELSEDQRNILGKIETRLKALKESISVNE